ncbi:hypothetical protein [Sphingosinicella sp. BN140058]|uniref:hypothetical protein n=1 Tax=Sphingosinicella sp. BN140058 TaxID=1892855 RepID=UPI00101278A3|nr:hypothetical protein [Sphingosinicella sp. BN140058]QAY75908.1 hypothetical protein ETR14_04715 [Sphingosinicella sp. BN140058]
MEVFVPSRDDPEALALIARLKQLGLGGRDAAYLACIAPPAASDPSAHENYLSEFRFMVPPAQRAEAARLVGLERW